MSESEVIPSNWKGASSPSKPKVGVEKPAYGLPIMPGHTSPPRPAPTPAPQPAEEPAPREVRAVWISRFDLGSPPMKRGRLEDLINRAADAGFNVLLLQVRATGDAYYASNVEPWSYRLTSSRVADLGRNPGWDPLALAIETAHKQRVELHAYLNAFTLWECGRGAPPHTSPEHAYWKLAGYDSASQHYDPGWRVYANVKGSLGTAGPQPMGDTKTSPVACAEYLWASPGVERVHQQNIAVIRDIVSRYAVDGIHLDRLRYPGRQYSHDSETYRLWHAANPPVSLDNWQRDNLSRWIGRYGAEIKAASAGSVRAQTTFSAAVWFTYKKTKAITFATSQGYYDYFQDSHRWLSDGCVDAIAPMIYGTTFQADVAKWKALAEDHVKAQGTRQVWLGIGADFPTFDLLAERIAYARQTGARGVAIWSAGEIDRRGYWDDLKAGPFGS